MSIFLCQFTNVHNLWLGHKEITGPRPSRSSSRGVSVLWAFISCHIQRDIPAIITTRPRQNGRQFPADIFLNRNIWISIKIALKFVPWVPNNIPALVQITAWRLPGDKPLSEPMMVKITDAYLRHSALMSYVCPRLLIQISRHSEIRSNKEHWTLKRKYYFVKSFVTGCTGSGQNDNLRWSRWQNFWQNDDTSVSENIYFWIFIHISAAVWAM